MKIFGKEYPPKKKEETPKSTLGSKVVVGATVIGTLATMAPKTSEGATKDSVGSTHKIEMTSTTPTERSTEGDLPISTSALNKQETKTIGEKSPKEKLALVKEALNNCGKIYVNKEGKIVINKGLKKNGEFIDIDTEVFDSNFQASGTESINTQIVSGEINPEKLLEEINEGGEKLINEPSEGGSMVRIYENATLFPVSTEYFMLMATEAGHSKQEVLEFLGNLNLLNRHIDDLTFHLNDKNTGFRDKEDIQKEINTVRNYVSSLQQQTQISNENLASK